MTQPTAEPVPTPKTDAFEADGSPYSIRLYRPEQARILNFARELERDNAALQSKLAGATQRADTHLEQFKLVHEECEALRSALEQAQSVIHGLDAESVAVAVTATGDKITIGQVMRAALGGQS